jgi:hypothetical protein
MNITSIRPRIFSLSPKSREKGLAKAEFAVGYYIEMELEL